MFKCDFKECIYYNTLFCKESQKHFDSVYYSTPFCDDGVMDTQEQEFYDEFENEWED